MATLRRAGFGSVFEVENEKVGIGTTGTATNTIQVLGNVKSSDAKITGVSSFTTYEGFVDRKTKLSDSIDLSNPSGSISGEIIIEDDVVVSSASTLTSGVNQLTSLDSFSVPTGNTDGRSHCTTPGSLRFNEDILTLEFYTGEQWKTVNSIKDDGSRGRGVWAGGVESPGAEIQIMDYVTISTRGNAITFGEIAPNVESRMAGSGNAVRGIWAGTNDTDSHEIIQFITPTSTGNTNDFGDLSVGRGTGGAAASSTRFLLMAGRDPSNTNIIDYVEIMTTGNALDFGDTVDVMQWTCGAGSPTRALRFGGENNGHPSHGGRRSDIGLTIIASKGNEVKFGDCTTSRGAQAACSNSVRGLCAGGEPQSSSFVDYVTIASEGDAIQFGDLGIRTSLMAGCSSQTRGLFGGGNGPTNSYQNNIHYVEIATTGQVLDFGDLTIGRWSPGALSDSHGGLGGF